MVLLENIFEQFFYSFPHSEPKPPISIRPLHTVYEEGQGDGQTVVTTRTSIVSGVEIQFAVAGFEEEDLKVWFEDRILCVEGNNLRRENVAEKFQCSFSRRISIRESLSVEKAEISLKNGILAIMLPKQAPEEGRRYLLGSAAD